MGISEIDRQRAFTAIDEYVQQESRREAVAFFKWNASQASEYIDYLRRVDRAEGVSEKELELDRFENSTIDGRYDLYLLDKQNK